MKIFAHSFLVGQEEAIGLDVMWDVESSLGILNLGRQVLLGDHEFAQVLPRMGQVAS